MILNCSGCPSANTNEKNILWRLLQLLRLNIELVFVTDGPQRPDKRGKPRSKWNSDPETVLLRELLSAFDVPWHRAPAEAEAECVKLQTLGIVDAVWTEDADALMFGGHTVLRFKYASNKKKDNMRVRVYRTEDILKMYPALDRESMVLFAVLCGGDYDMSGLSTVGPQMAMKAIARGLGKSLCEASRSDQLPKWREELQEFLASEGSRVQVPQSFPKPKAVNDYDRPKVSEDSKLLQLKERWWKGVFDESVLLHLLGREYITFIYTMKIVTKQYQQDSTSGFEITMTLLYPYIWFGR